VDHRVVVLPIKNGVIEGVLGLPVICKRAPYPLLRKKRSLQYTSPQGQEFLKKDSKDVGAPVMVKERTRGRTF